MKRGTQATVIAAFIDQRGDDDGPEQPISCKTASFNGQAIHTGITLNTAAFAWGGDLVAEWFSEDLCHVFLSETSLGKALIRELDARGIDHEVRDDLMA